MMTGIADKAVVLDKKFADGYRAVERGFDKAGDALNTLLQWGFTVGIYNKDGPTAVRQTFYGLLSTVSGVTFNALLGSLPFAPAVFKFLKSDIGIPGVALPGITVELNKRLGAFAGERIANAFRQTVNSLKVAFPTAKVKDIEAAVDGQVDAIARLPKELQDKFAKIDPKRLSQVTSRLLWWAALYTLAGVYSSKISADEDVADPTTQDQFLTGAAASVAATLTMNVGTAAVKGALSYATTWWNGRTADADAGVPAGDPDERLLPNGVSDDVEQGGAAANGYGTAPTG